jgi:hypothetical protein
MDSIQTVEEMKKHKNQNLKKKKKKLSNKEQDEIM